MRTRQEIIEKIFDFQGDDGFWKVIPPNHKYHPTYLHYVPNFRATLWTLVLLADLELDKKDHRVIKPTKELQGHFFDKEYGIYSLKEDHFPIPCLNGNMIYIDTYFNGELSSESKKSIDFFNKYQRFDDGCYEGEKNKFCSNKSCYGKHTCYWGITELFKGISFIPENNRSGQDKKLLDKCIQFVLLHKVCFSSHKEGKLLARGIDNLTFPNMYKSDFLELLWLLKREQIISDDIQPAIDLLKSKQLINGEWNLEKKMNNMHTSMGPIGKPNQFIAKRANEVLSFYN